MTAGKPLIERFLAKVEVTETCWLWTGGGSLGYGQIRAMGQAAHAAKTHCIHGHPFAGDNLYIRPDTGTRQCRACCKIRYEASK